MSLQDAIEAAMLDAEQLTGLPKDLLGLESAESVIWPDGSAGCPQPGMMYTQALVPGYRIRIRAGERLLGYHATLRGKPFLCPDGRAIDPLPQDTI